MSATAPNELAIIDIGGNAVNLALFMRHPGSTEIVRTYRASQRLRLIEEMDGNGFLSQAAILNAENTIVTYCSWCESAGISIRNVVCVATSAVREANNRDVLVDAVRSRLDLQLKILTGEEEAALGVDAVRHSLAMENGIVFDLGGGDLHITRVLRGRSTNMTGLPLGALRLSRHFPHRSALSQGQLEALSAFVLAKFARLSWLAKSASGASVIGFGGTVRDLAEFIATDPHKKQNVDGMVVSVEQVDEVIRLLSSLSLDEVRLLPGMPPERGDMALNGAIVVRELLRAARADQMQINGASIREGLALQHFAAIS